MYRKFSSDAVMLSIDQRPCYTPQPVWSEVPISSTEACRDSSIPSYIGWIFLSESCTNSASRCSTAFTVKRLPISWNCANQSQVSHYQLITATSPIRHPTASIRTAPPAPLLLWPTGFLCGWSFGLEFPAGQLAESDYWREQFQTISEDASVRNVLMHSAH